jgi:hypothetical protein
VLGAAVGFVPGIGIGAGLLFVAGTTGVDLSRRTTDVTARLGDEIWQIEEIGKVLKSSFLGADHWVAMHVNAYFIVDPYRARVPDDDRWLIHEDRTELRLDL